MLGKLFLDRDDASCSAVGDEFCVKCFKKTRSHLEQFFSLSELMVTCLFGS